jgi:predicted RNA-binding protein
MAGRYARWNHGIKINDILEEAKEYAGQMGK